MNWLPFDIALVTIFALAIRTIYRVYRDRTDRRFRHFHGEL